MTSVSPATHLDVDDSTEEMNCGLRERKKRGTRKAIHRAALELAHESGVEALTVDAIAERAGVSPRTFFNYFAGKEDAIVGSQPHDLEDLAEFVRARPAAESPRDVVRALAIARVDGLERDPRGWAMRRSVAVTDPAIGLRFLGVYARADHALVDALVERARAAEGRRFSGERELAVAVEGYAALGAFRAAVRSQLRGSPADSFTDLVERAFARL